MAKRLVQILFSLRGELSPSWQCKAGATGSALMEILLLCFISHFLFLIRVRELRTGLFVIRAKQDVLRKQFFLMNFSVFSEYFKLIFATQLLGI